MNTTEYLIEKAWREGYEEGFIAGFVLGKKEYLESLALELLEDGIAISIISNVTGLSLCQVKNLKNTNVLDVGFFDSRQYN